MEAISTYKKIKRHLDAMKKKKATPYAITMELNIRNQKKRGEGRNPARILVSSNHHDIPS